MSHFSYDEANYPRMGAVRKSFQTNSLLVKPKLGEVKKATYELPEPNYSYGLCSITTEGVKDVFTHRERLRGSEGVKGPYFISMNRLAQTSDVIRASELRSFRKCHYVPLPVSNRVGGHLPLPSERNPNHTYGKRNPRHENMKKVMQNAYAEDWIKLQTFQQHKYKVPKLQLIPPVPNRATILSARARLQRDYPTPPKERFILSKFKNVKHKIDNVQSTPLKRD